MTWHYELMCDSCDFRRRWVNAQSTQEANEHEARTLDHWVQQVEVLDGPPKKSRRQRR